MEQMLHEKAQCVLPACTACLKVHRLRHVEETNEANISSFLTDSPQDLTDEIGYDIAIIYRKLHNTTIAQQ
jgi:hypothetical protein